MQALLLTFLFAVPAAVGQSYFVWRYLRYDRWKESNVGRALLVKSAALAVLVDLALLDNLASVTKNDTFISVTGHLETFAYALITLAILWQLFILIKVQNNAHPITEDLDEAFDG